jgi:hypothetical protein
MKGDKKTMMFGTDRMTSRINGEERNGSLRFRNSRLGRSLTRRSECRLRIPEDDLQQERYTRTIVPIRG